MENTLLTYKDMQELFKVSRMTIYNYTQQGLLKSYRVGRKTYYKKSEVEQFINNLK